MKYAFIRENVKNGVGIVRYCRVLGVSRSGYYEWLRRKESRRAQVRRLIDGLVAKMHEKSRKAYGSPRIYQALRAAGHRHGRSTVERAMRRQGLKSVYHRRFRPQTTDSKSTRVPAPNVLAQQFTASHPNERWVSDITYIPTITGWLYLCVIIDLYSRKVVGYHFSTSLRTSLVIEAFHMAVVRRGAPQELVFHSDQGCQYDADEFRLVLAQHGVTRSMSRVGNCYDNAVCESFFKTLKVELVYQTRFESHTHAARDITRWIESFYNSERIHSSLGYLSPVAFEAKTALAQLEAA